MNPALRASAAHLFVESLESPDVSVDDEHHLFRVLRLRDGEPVTITDGAGRWRSTTVRGRALQLAGDVQEGADGPSLAVAAAIPKGDRLEWMVQKLTEIGVREITLLHCARSAVRWDTDKAQRQLVRLRRVAREAAMQSRRLTLPAVSGPLQFESVVAQPATVVADPAGVPLVAGEHIDCVMIGPEGGFSPDELAAARRTASIGDRILRVETAAVAAAVKILL